MRGKKTLFVNPTEGEMSLERVAQEIKSFISQNPEATYRLIIGSDSQERRDEGRKFLSLVGAVVIHRVGSGGRYFLRKRRGDQPPSLRSKIYTETFFSLEIAGELLPVLNDTLNGERPYELEIHIDVGQAGATRDMIREVVGMVNGNGFKAKTKPDSYGASSVADKHA